MSSDKTYLTPEVKALVGVTGEFVEASIWEAGKEGLRRFTQALMDPDPRYWDEEFARTTKYGEIVTPAIYCTYLNRTPPSAPDPVTRAFQEDPLSDGLGNVRRGRGSLPEVPTELKRHLNAGNQIEVFKYPSLGDRIYSQTKYASITERVGTDASHMLIVTMETAYYNQKGEMLCISRQSGIRR